MVDHWWFPAVAYFIFQIGLKMDFLVYVTRFAVLSEFDIIDVQLKRMTMESRYFPRIGIQ